MTQDININGIISKSRNLLASLNKLHITQNMMPKEKEKVINNKNMMITFKGSLGIASKPNQIKPSTKIQPTIIPMIVSRMKRAMNVANGVTCR